MKNIATVRLLNQLAKPGIYFIVYTNISGIRRYYGLVETDEEDIQYQLNPDTHERVRELSKDGWRPELIRHILGPFARIKQSSWL